MKYIKYSFREFHYFEGFLSIDDELVIRDILISLIDKYNIQEINDTIFGIDDVLYELDTNLFYYQFKIMFKSISLSIIFPEDYKINDEIKEDIDDFKTTLENHGYEVYVSGDPWEEPIRSSSAYMNGNIEMQFTIKK